MGIGVRAEDVQAAPVTGVFALRARDRRALVATLERVAAVAPQLSDGELQDLASQLCRQTASDPRRATRGDGEIRVGIVAWRRDQLAERARLAASLVGMVRNATIIGTAGVRVSCGAGGRVVLVFPGFAATAVAQAGTLAGSLATLRWLDRLGVTASAAVGHSLGEIAGLVWAGALSAAEAARLVAQYGEVLSGLGARRTAMVRLTADEETAQALCGSGLSIAAHESPLSHVLAGPVPAVRDMTRLVARLGIAAEVLDVSHGLHSPAMAACAGPLGSVLAQTRFTSVRRRLVSTVVARELTRRDDVAALLHAQLTSPVQFAEAVRVAGSTADLLFVADKGNSLGLSAAANCGLPVTGFVASAGWPEGRNGTLWDASGTGGAGPVHDTAAADAAATLFAAGAMPSGTPLAGKAPARPVDIWRDRQRPATQRTALARAVRGRSRFMETITEMRPGSDLTAEARISLRTDPYLADYLVDGRPVLPAAMALEAMAQAASELARQPLRSVRAIAFRSPAIVPGGRDDRQMLLRVHARVSGDGVETVLRTGSGERLAEYARAIFAGPGQFRKAAAGLPRPGGDRRAIPASGSGMGRGPGPGAGQGRGLGPGSGRVLTGAELARGIDGGSRDRVAEEVRIVDGADLYGPVYFQTGRFRRVALVSGTPPRWCRAIVRGRDELPWFGRLPLPTDLLILGSPGLNDAALQVAQACVPHRRLVPTGCDSLTVSGTEVPGAVELRVFLVSAIPGRLAGEGEMAGAEYIWDVHGYDAAGAPVAAWIGLRMRDAGPVRLTSAYLDADTFPTLSWSIRDPVPSSIG
ncbi:MAG TPA: acyltransferase domain-containing protein [Streptosporangiaceae bacterium]|nr:acyltransferase domain-containing protein [Streptosporangiaceae bacterium]